jgi:hypothetical protein
VVALATVVASCGWPESCDFEGEAVAPPAADSASSKPAERLMRLVARDFLLVIVVLPIGVGRAMVLPTE